MESEEGTWVAFTVPGSHITRSFLPDAGEPS